MAGTVTGIIGRKLEIVYDEPFIGGTNLLGRCSMMRGAIGNFADVFNIKFHFVLRVF